MWHASGTAGEDQPCRDVAAAGSAPRAGRGPYPTTTCLIGKSSESSAGSWPPPVRTGPTCSWPTWRPGFGPASWSGCSTTGSTCCAASSASSRLAFSLRASRGLRDRPKSRSSVRRVPLAAPAVEAIARHVPPNAVPEHHRVHRPRRRLRPRQRRGAGLTTDSYRHASTAPSSAQVGSRSWT
jgi:hypothetical protein